MNRHQRRLTKKQASSPQDHAQEQLNHLVVLVTQHQAAGRFNQAEEIYRKILAIRPDSAETHNNFGYVLEKQEKYEEAAACYKRALAIKPDFSIAYNNLGHILEKQNKFDEAATCYERAITIAPRFIEAHNNLCSLLHRQGKIDEAAGCYKRLLAIRPDLAEAHNNLGCILQQKGRLNEAALCYAQALAIKPNYADAHNNLGGLLREQGKLDEAVTHFTRALDIQPDYAEAHYNRAFLKTFDLSDTDLATLEKLADGLGYLPAAKSKYIHFAFSKALNDVGEYARSFEHLLKGNDLKRQEVHYDEALDIQSFQRIANMFNPELFERFQDTGDPSSVPIFIVGMPRSGSTLVEQILASHPQVQGGGELENLATVINNNVSDAHGQPIPYPAYISALDTDGLRKLGQAYTLNLPQLLDGKTRITDKRLPNCLAIGLIRLILPNARIIHTMRDPVDTCFSCFSTLFASGQDFTYDLAELGRYYQRYSKLMAHWRSVLPSGSMLEFSYEALVDDFEPQAKRLIEYCGLPWDDNCLSFYKNKRAVSTASTVQVRKPLYRSSVQRWRHYEPYLGSLLAELATCY